MHRSRLTLLKRKECPWAGAQQQRKEDLIDFRAGRKQKAKDTKAAYIHSARQCDHLCAMVLAQ